MPHFIHIERIEVGENRQRRSFDAAAIEELRTSIQESQYGLQHPLVVRKGPNPGTFLLVAGERRLRAIRDIYELGGEFRHAGSYVAAGQVPVVDLGELDPLDAFEAELEENIRRVDLSVMERATATASLMELRTKQAARDGAPAPTQADIAREIFDVPAGTPVVGQPANTVSDHLLIARHRDDPDVAKATSVKEAVKIVKKKEEARRVTALAATVGASYTADRLQLHHADSDEWLRDRTAEFDIILCDPPYGMGADQFGDSGTKGGDAGAHFYDDSYESWSKLMEWFAPTSIRVTKPGAHLYAFCDIDRFEEFRERLAAEGWNVHRTPLIWHNPDGFRAPWPEHGPQRKYELILYARRGEKKCSVLRGDVLEYRKDAATGHPAQKPVNLLIDLLRRSAAPGDRVLDPFAGSGPILAACHDLRLDCVAIERDQTAYGMALKRLQALKSEPELPL